MESFIARHRLLVDHLALAETPLWSSAQASLLREGVALDAEWAAVVERLDERLRDGRPG